MPKVNSIVAAFLLLRHDVYLLRSSWCVRAIGPLVVTVVSGFTLGAAALSTVGGGELTSSQTTASVIPVAHASSPAVPAMEPYGRTAALT
eukprot:3084500-Prymnesium_polylepis.1